MAVHDKDIVNCVITMLNEGAYYGCKTDSGRHTSPLVENVNAPGFAVYSIE